MALSYLAFPFFTCQDMTNPGQAVTTRDEAPAVTPSPCNGPQLFAASPNNTLPLVSRCLLE